MVFFLIFKEITNHKITSFQIQKPQYNNQISKDPVKNGGKSQGATLDEGPRSRDQ